MNYGLRTSNKTEENFLFPTHLLLFLWIMCNKQQLLAWFSILH